MERYAEIIAALKIRTSNKKGRHLSTARAIQLRTLATDRTREFTEQLRIVEERSGRCRRVFTVVGRVVSQAAFSYPDFTRRP